MKLARFAVFFSGQRVFRQLPSPYTSYTSTFNEQGYCVNTAPLGGAKPKVRTRKTTTKTFLDLPSTYITPAGKEAIPLEEFIPGFVLGTYSVLKYGYVT